MGTLPQPHYEPNLTLVHFQQSHSLKNSLWHHYT